jgi:hypothetical protein
LISLYFVRYATGYAPHQKTYLYLVWMLWAFIRIRSASRPLGVDSLYDKLPGLGGDIITFNYTEFFPRQIAKRVRHFHGTVSQYLRVDDRRLVTDDPMLRAATTVDGVAAFIHDLRLDVRDHPSLDMPAIVPPVSFKPVMSRLQLSEWAEADRSLQEADRIVIVGYSFATADEHFNDLLRNTRATTRVLVVNPDLTGCCERVCRILGIQQDALTDRERRGFTVRASNRVTCVGAGAKHLTSEFVEEMFR